jgi:hypothetical protein
MNFQQPKENSMNQAPQPKPGFGDFAIEAISTQRNQAMHAHAMASAKAAELQQENGELRAQLAEANEKLAALTKPKTDEPAGT